MVKKYFRKFLCAVCAAMSVAFGCSNVAGAYVAAAAEEVSTEFEAVSEAESATEEVMEQETKLEDTTEKQAEEDTEVVEEVVKVAAEATDGEADSENPNNDDEDGAPEESDVQQSDENGNENEKEAEKEDGSGTDADNQEKPAPAEIEKKELDGNGASLRYSRTNFGVGDAIDVSVSGASSETAIGATIEYDIPDGTFFKAMKVLPKFADAESKVEYKDAEGTWSDYTDAVDTASVKALRVIVSRNDENVGISQTREFAFTLTAEKSANATSSLLTKYTDGEKEVSRTSEAAIVIALQNSVQIDMKQDPATASRADEAKQTVVVSYQDAVSSKIIYDIDTSLNVTNIEIAEDSMLIGGKAIVTSDSGDTELEISGTIDLEGYANVRRIILIPKDISASGQKAEFVATIKARKDDKEAINTVTVVAKSGDNQETVSKTLKTTIDRVSITKPEIVYSGEKVAFGDQFEIEFGKTGFTSYNVEGDFEYTILIPDFVELDSIVLPEYEGASKIEVFVKKDDEESSLGECKAGEEISVHKSGISAVHIVITPEDRSVKAEGAGKLSFKNNLEKNKVNYFGFRAESKVSYKDIDYLKTSDIVGVTFQNHEEANVPQPQPQSNTTAQTDVSPVYPVQTDSVATEENTEAESIRQAESERKDQIRDDSIRREKELKERQKAVLEGRIGSIRGSVAGSVSGIGSASAKSPRQITDKYANWEVRPIDEGIVQDVVKKELPPISEKIVVNLVPDDNEAE